jgi:hypothetical protein
MEYWLRWAPAVWQSPVIFTGDKAGAQFPKEMRNAQFDQMLSPA